MWVFVVLSLISIVQIQKWKSGFLLLDGAAASPVIEVVVSGPRGRERSRGGVAAFQLSPEAWGVGRPCPLHHRASCTSVPWVVGL